MLAVAVLTSFAYSISCAHAAPTRTPTTLVSHAVQRDINSSSCLSVANPIESQLPIVARANVPYSWSFSPITFTAPNGSIPDSLDFTTSTLPGWITFDSSNRSFTGLPGVGDVGTTSIQITAASDGCQAQDELTIHTVEFPSVIEVASPIASQFVGGNPSLSSVYALEPGSALASSNAPPAVRVPPGWSFSIGFDASTILVDSQPVVQTKSEEYSYVVRTADGLDLPSWSSWHQSPSILTLTGSSPPIPSDNTETLSLALSLVCDSFPGNSMMTIPFDVVVAAHELSSSTSTLPVSNFTASQPFSLPLTSASNFMGVLVDGDPIDLANISTVAVDTSQYSNWLSWDDQSWTLSGTAPSLSSISSPVILPAQVSATFGQTLTMTLPLSFFPSLFTESSVKALQSGPGDKINFDLANYFANGSTLHEGEDEMSWLTMSATYNPTDTSGWFYFDNETFVLTGQIPLNSTIGDSKSTPTNSTNSTVLPSSLTVNFQGHSSLTGTTSFLSLPIDLLPARSGGIQNPFGSSNPRTRALARNLAIGLGTGLGFVVLLATLACCRRHYSAKERLRRGDLPPEKGEGIGTAYKRALDGLGFLEADLTGGGYGWTEKMGEVRSLSSGGSDPRSRDTSADASGSTPLPVTVRKFPPPSLGRGDPAQRPNLLSPHPDVPPGLGDTSSTTSPRTTTKAAFFNNLRARATRAASGASGRGGNYVLKLVTASKRGRGKVTGDMISKPVLLSGARDNARPFGPKSNSILAVLSGASKSARNPVAPPFEPDLSVKATCRQITLFGSPDSQAGALDTVTTLTTDLKSASSGRSDRRSMARSSAHSTASEAEAVSRERSSRGRDGAAAIHAGPTQESGLSSPTHQRTPAQTGIAASGSGSNRSGFSEEDVADAIVRTASVHSAASRGSAGVGVAQAKLVQFKSGGRSAGAKGGGRIVSHRAEIVSTPSTSHGIEEGASYVRAFGEDEGAPSTKRIATRGTVASSDATLAVIASPEANDGPLYVKKASEPFEFKHPLPFMASRGGREKGLSVLQVDGSRLPGFMTADVKQGYVFIHGYSIFRPGGRKVKVGVFTGDGACVSRFVLEIR